MLRLGGRMMVPKFRVWDEIQHKMLQVDYIEFIDGKAYWVEASSADDNPQGGNDGPVRDNSQLKLEQSTGLKDVNGKEIYENDIIKVFAVDDPEDYYHAPIKYWIDDNYPAFDIDRKYVPSARWYDANILSTISESGYEKMEVVGNVHENPELLEAQHDTRAD